MANRISWALSLASLLPTIGCKDAVAPVSEQAKWNRVTGEIERLDVRAIREHGGELYAGGFGASGSILRSSDGIAWMIHAGIIGEAQSELGIDAMTFSEQSLYVGIAGDGIYRHGEQSGWRKLHLTEFGILPTDMCSVGADVYVGTGGQYFVGKVSGGDTVSLVFNSLDAQCTNTSIIQQILVTRLLPHHTRKVLASVAVSGHYVVSIDDAGIQCFHRDGLSEEDIQYGCHDLAWKGDTLLAAGSSLVKMFHNGNWSIFGDSLPMTPQRFRPYGTALAVYGNRVFVGTNYVGVLEWKAEKGWESVAPGLPQFEDGFHDAIAYLMVYQRKLIACFGSGKPWRSVNRGLYIVPLE